MFQLQKNENHIRFHKILYVVFVSISLLCTSCKSTNIITLLSDISNAAGSPYQEFFSNSEAITAMKDALIEGISASSKELSAANGYFGNAALKIILPPEAQNIIYYLDKIPGGQKLVDDVVLRINISAENAAKEVMPIFKNAIASMTVQDGISIVCGEDNAATTYLHEKTYDELMNLYCPKISMALARPLVLGISATTVWNELITKYNEVARPVNAVAKLAGQGEPMPQIEVDLASYATGKALDGLFIKIGEEELKIRENPFDYASKLIQKVYGAIKDGLVPRHK